MRFERDARVPDQIVRAQRVVIVDREGDGRFRVVGRELEALEPDRVQVLEYRLGLGRRSLHLPPTTGRDLHFVLSS